MEVQAVRGGPAASVRLEEAVRGGLAASVRGGPAASVQVGLAASVQGDLAASKVGGGHPWEAADLLAPPPFLPGQVPFQVDAGASKAVPVLDLALAFQEDLCAVD